MTKNQKIGGGIAGAVLVGGALFLLNDQPRTRMLPTMPCSPEVGWEANQTWPPFAGSQAPSKNPDTGYRIAGVKVEQGMLRATPSGGTEIVVTRTPTSSNPENAEWVPFNPTNSNHCNTASLFSSYGMNWSHGPVHGLHDDCKGYYENVHGKPPTDMEWKDCDYNYAIFLDWKAQDCAKEGGKWDRATGTCRFDGTFCGDGTCQEQYLENNRNCRNDCPTGGGGGGGGGGGAGGGGGGGGGTPTNPCTKPGEACRPEPVPCPTCPQLSQFEVERAQRMCQDSTWSNLKVWQRRSACDQCKVLRDFAGLSVVTFPCGAAVSGFYFDDRDGRWAYAEPLVSAGSYDVAAFESR